LPEKILSWKYFFAFCLFFLLIPHFKKDKSSTQDTRIASSVDFSELNTAHKIQCLL